MAFSGNANSYRLLRNFGSSILRKAKYAFRKASPTRPLPKSSAKAMPMTKELVSLCESEAVPKKFIDYMIENGMISPLNFVLAASEDRKMVDSVIIADYGGLLSTTEKIAVRKVWWTCEIMAGKEKDAKRSTKSRDGGGIAEGDVRNLNDAFQKRHGFRLGYKRLLSENLQGKLLAQYSSTTKNFEFIPANKLILKVIMEAEKVRKDVETADDGTLIAKDHIESEVDNFLMLWKRIRALMNTMSFITIQNPTWLPYDVAERFSDNVLEWMSTKHPPAYRYAPISHFLLAYRLTFTAFLEEIHLNDTSMASLIAREESYRTHWVSWNGEVDTQERGSKRGAVASSGSRDPRQMATAREVQGLRDQNARLHQRIDNLMYKNGGEKNDRGSGSWSAQGDAKVPKGKGGKKEKGTYYKKDAKSWRK